MSKLTLSGVYKFYMEYQMLIVLNSLFEELMSVRLSLEYRLESLDFNNIADEMLFEREHQYTKKGIWRTGRSAGHLDAAARGEQKNQKTEKTGKKTEKTEPWKKTD
jgi:hypothetical protein